jgi:hypothetical protein
MRIRPIRSIAATSLAAVLIAGLAACGGDDTDTVAAAAESGTSAGTNPETGTGTAAAALTAKGTGNPFADTRTAASHMPMTAAALATGIAKAAKLKGDVDAPAAKLRSDLTYLLTDHVYLAGIAVATAYHAGADSDAFKAAAKSLDDNSVDVAKAVGSVAGAEKEKQFLQSWRTHINDFVAYAVGAKTGGAEGKKAKAAAVKSLTGYAVSSGEFFNEITKGALPKAAVTKAFTHHIETLAAAVDSFAAGDGKGYDKLKTAGDHMADSAKALAGGIATAAKLEGNSDSAASTLRANLTSMLTTHTYLAGIAVFAAYTDEDTVESAGFKAAAAALDKNTDDLGAAVGSVAGAEKQKTFEQVWRTHIGDFVTYAVGVAGDDAAKKDEATKNLDGYRTAAGGFFETVTGGALPADAVAEELKMHIETLFGAIESLKAALLPA